MKKAELTTDKLPVVCFAPPLTDELLARYEAMIDALPDDRGEVRDAMRECLAACKLWWELPESTRTADAQRFNIRHRGQDQTFSVVPLEKAHVEALSDAVPYGYELEAIQRLFDGIDPAAEKPLRDAAFHLLWHAKELCLDREPLTNDKL
jgi:hypothetical protein